MIRLPDVPKLVSLDFLRELDAQAPGTWLAQPKIDGRRRMIYKKDGVYTWHAKNRDDCQPVPAHLRAQFEALSWLDGIGVDCEWSGPRHKGGVDKLWVFDLLQWQGEWTGAWTFSKRVQYLQFWFLDMLDDVRATIHIVPLHVNPGLLDRYSEQLTNPISEGLVVRKATSKMLGGVGQCKVNPEWFKVKHRNIKEK